MIGIGTRSDYAMARTTGGTEKRGRRPRNGTSFDRKGPGTDLPHQLLAIARKTQQPVSYTPKANARLLKSEPVSVPQGERGSRRDDFTTISIFPAYPRSGQFHGHALIERVQSRLTANGRPATI